MRRRYWTGELPTTGRPDGVRRFGAALCVLQVALCTSSASAQPQTLPKIEQVRVGLAPAQGDVDAGAVRLGAWAPVYVKIKGGKDQAPPNGYRLVVESSDAEDAAYTYSTPVPALTPGEDYFATTYVRGGHNEWTVSLRTPDGRLVPGTRVGRDSAREVLNPGHTLYLALGSRLPGLRRSLLSDQLLANQDDDNFTDERGSRRLAFLDSVRDMPDRWFGYDAVDIVVLTTSGDSFVTQLLDPTAAPRRKALGEWVRRGGKLVIAAGRGRQTVVALLDAMPLPEFDKQPLLNCAVEGGVARKALPVLTRWCSTGREPPPMLQNIELTVLRPNARAEPHAEPVNALIAEAPEGNSKDDLPVLVHAACGTGRVIVTAFDFDAPPFSTWAGQKAFWDKLEVELLPRNATVRKDDAVVNNRFSDQSNELGEELKRGLEGFQEVPVISFGWVALFILIYIVIVGPLDYLILKKVFKRLELTWITFPTVVLVISAAAYFTAYALKGDDLRINKIDVVDFDLHGPTPQAYGTSWLTLFSPRIQNYTVGVEPAAPLWADAPASGRTMPAAVVTVLDGSNPQGRGGSGGLFRRAYSYAPDAVGLENVSIPVWATRSFAARWRAPLTAGKAPIEAELRHARDKEDPTLLGSIINRLPVELRDVSLLYNGRRYAVGTVPAKGSVKGSAKSSEEGAVPIDNLNVGGQGQQVNQWLLDGTALSNFGASRQVTSALLIKDLLFHGPPAQSQKSNGGWRELDQCWRLRPLVEASSRPQPQSVYRDEVLLVARIASQAGNSETVGQSNASPTHLWLGELPGAKNGRPTLSGYIVQDTYIRVYLPVNP